ncbi:hypothetical protein RHSP_29850 [Rhizobium freirei PRF 81]|uniref:Transmembrane protein n=1 Tax=Rhizobium freirei PRF 81 TaxID=363754 RepID=N6VDW9_9HYPH|nr:DUF2270 domain-containing protein [Rhizobium freirei]ENN89272.1 hypothetical protein RHSP_29850 [Rhizobium freirei PRF 81]
MDTELTAPNPTSSPAERGRPSLPSSSAEVTNTLTHYYRGELARMTSWRDRIDRTSNWAITVVAALLSVSLSTPTSHHGVLLFGMMLITLLLMIEARRYRFFDVYRSRVRQLERNYFAQILAPQSEFSNDWALAIASSLRTPRLQLSYAAAAQRRLRRNYCWMYAILLLAWVLKISTPRLQTDSAAQQMAHSWSYVTDNAALGPIPGVFVIVLVAAFYSAIVYGTLHHGRDDGDFVHGEAHV